VEQILLVGHVVGGCPAGKGGTSESYFNDSEKAGATRLTLLEGGAAAGRPTAKPK